MKIGLFVRSPSLSLSHSLARFIGKLNDDKSTRPFFFVIFVSVRSYNLYDFLWKQIKFVYDLFVRNEILNYRVASGPTTRKQPPAFSSRCSLLCGRASCARFYDCSSNISISIE